MVEGAPERPFKLKAKRAESRSLASLGMIAAGLRRPAKRDHFLSSTSTYSASMTPSSFLLAWPSPPGAGPAPALGPAPACGPAPAPPCGWAALYIRSEERRVGKECRWRGCEAEEKEE